MVLGETTEEAAKRKVFEETNLVVEEYLILEHLFNEVLFIYEHTFYCYYAIISLNNYICK